MNSLHEIHTPRLTLYRLSDDHLDDLVRMHLDARVMATLGGLRSPDETRAWLARHQEHWRKHGFGLWLARKRETGQFAGRGGLAHVEIDGRDEIEVGYSLLSDYWGRGLATELAQANIRVAFDVLNLAEIVCFTLTTNHASQRVMQKAGFRYERHLLYKELPHVLYRLRRSEERTPSPPTPSPHRGEGRIRRRMRSGNCSVHRLRGSHSLDSLARHNSSR